jgi:hypothetical protein
MAASLFCPFPEVLKAQNILLFKLPGSDSVDTGLFGVDELDQRRP